jgi:hypothetical protein
VSFGPDRLFKGESLLRSKLANAIVKRSDYDLKEFGHSDALLKLVAMEGTEGLGGKLHLTNYRLVFTTHAINRVTGTFGILLPTIQSVENTSLGLSRRISVDTLTGRYDFVAWGVPAFIVAITRAKERLTEQQQGLLREEIKTSPQKLGDGFQRSAALGDLNVESLRSLADAVTKPTEVANLLNLIELFSKSPSE